MFARHFALCCLLLWSTTFGHSQEIAGREVIVYLKAGAEIPVTTLAEVKSELTSLMPAVGVHIIGWQPADSNRASARIVVAEFAGDCYSHAGAETPLHPLAMLFQPLASTSVADGRILPFAHVDCSALHDLIHSSLALEPATRREALYGRSIARLLAHELYHIVLNTTDHAASGIAKAHFSARDLLSDRFEFEPSPSLHAKQRGASSVEVHAAASKHFPTDGINEW